MVATSQRPPATDYVAIELASGKRITITNTCAANVLGLIKPEYFAYGNANAARKAMKPLADYMGKTVEEVATQISTRAYEKIEPVITDLAGKYRLEKDQISLVGVGGGAASLIGFCSDKMGLRYSIPDNAEVISSIGVALAMVRDVVERVVPNPTPEDIRSIKAEAINKAVLCKAASYRNVVSQLWEELAIYQQDAILRPDYYICAGARVMDFSGSVDLDKIMMLMEVEMQMIDPNDDVIIVGAKNSL